MILHARSFRSARSLLALSLAAALASTGLTAPAQGAVVADGGAGTSVGSGYGFNPSEKCLMRKINRARRSRGMRALDWDRQVGYVARRHAYAMASSRAAYHDYQLGQKVTRWRRLGQNTGRGGKCRRIFRSFMHSSTHRANIFGRWRHLGVGAVWSGGRLYVQQVFESRLNPGNIYSYP